MSSIIDSIHYKPLKIPFVDIAHSYNSQKEIRVIFHLPENFVCGNDDKILLHKNGVFENNLNDLKVDVKTAKYYENINGCFFVYFSVDMLAGIKNDSGDEYRFLYSNSENEIIGASLIFKFMQNAEIPPNTASMINDLGYTILEESHENEQLIISLKKKISSIEDMFETFYTKIQLAFIGKASYFPFEKYIALTNVEKEKEINIIIETLNKQPRASSDFVISEMRTLKDDHLSKQTQENNELSFKIKNMKIEPIFHENNIKSMTNKISSSVNEPRNQKFKEMGEKIEEKNTELEEHKSSSHEKNQDLNINKTKLEQIFQNNPKIQENKQAEPKVSLNLKNSNVEINNNVDLCNSKTLEENKNIKKDEAIVSLPHSSNEIKDKTTSFADPIIDKKDPIITEKIQSDDNIPKTDIKGDKKISVEPSQEIPKKMQQSSFLAQIRGTNHEVTFNNLNNSNNNPNMKPEINAENKKVNETEDSNKNLSSRQKGQEETKCPVCFKDFKSSDLKNKEIHVNSHFS